MRLTGLSALIRRRVHYRVAFGGLLFMLALTLTGAGAFFSGNNLLFLIFAAMLALLLVSGFLGRLVLAGLELELLLPLHVAARTPTEARVRIRNLKRFTPSFSIELSGLGDRQASDGAAMTRPIYFPLIPGHAVIESAIELIFPRRGRHNENLFLISTSFPFGFIRRSIAVELHRETIVYPSLQGDPATEALLDDLAGDGNASRRGPGREFYRIRAYEASDEARHVDWKTTARTGVLHTREFARDEKPAIEVRLDTRIGAGQEGQFEALVEQCAFASWMLAAEGRSILFRCDNTCIMATGGEGIYDILLALALVNPVVTLPGRVAVPAVNGRDDDFSGPESSPGIVFSTQMDE